MRNEKKKVEINHDYFLLSTKWENLKYFFNQGNVIAHFIDRFKWYYYPKYFIASSFPTHLEIEASSACQMRCPMCKTTDMVDAGVANFGNMDYGLYKKIINDCVHNSLYSIKLSWRGEPLLNPDIVKMVSYAKNNGIKDVAFLTNGERLNHELTRDLVNAGLDWIGISFDGMEDIYNKIRKPAKFEETVEKIKYIRQYRESVKRKKPLIRIQSIHSAIMGRENEFLNLWRNVADRVNFIADQKRSINQKDYRHDPCYICPSPWQRMCISFNGKVVQCYGDYMEGNILGNVNEKSIKEIWNDKPFKELRRLIKSGKRLTTKPCRTCSDGGVTDEKEIMIGDRKIKAVHYVHQGIDVKGIVGLKES